MATLSSRKTGGLNEKMSFTLANYTQIQSQQSQSAEKEAVIRFVIPEGLTKQSCSKTLQRAWQLCMDYDMNAEWVDFKHVLTQKPKEGSIYVCDPFGGKAYDVLVDYYNTSRVAQKFALIGPMCLEYIFTKREIAAAIQPRGFPFYTMAMKGAQITFTGFSSEQMGELSELVHKMNGVVQKHFSHAITHVVCAHVLTAKCLVATGAMEKASATERNVPLMTIDWIQAVWEDSKIKVVDCDDERYAKYECKVFQNVNMTASSIPSAEKNKLERMIVNGGGIFSRDFKRGTSQILIVPKPSGEKYKYALTWKVPCVTPEWVYESSKVGHILPHENFDPAVSSSNKKDILTSTQIEGGRAPGDLNYTNININMSGIQNEADNVDYIGESTNFINVTVGSVTNSTHSRISPRAASVEIEDRWADLQRAPKGFLENLKVYICDFQDSAKLDDLRYIINNSGAQCYVNLNPRVTHVIVVDKNISDAEKKTISKMPTKPHLLSLQWLVACAKNGGKLDELPFEVDLDLVLEVSNEVVQNNTGINDIENRGRRSVFQTHEEVQQLPQRSATDSASQNQNSTIKDADETETKVLFVGLQFYVCIDSPQEALEIENSIRTYKGEVVEDIDPGTSKVDIIIADPIYKDPNVNASRVFTKYWLVDVLESGSFEVANAPHYTAYPLETGTKKILSGTVVHISGYGYKQKEYIKQLCNGMGARVQQVFTKKKQRDALKTTHLICGETQNPKYKAAKRWNTTAVTMDWVIQCILQGRQLDADDFGLVDNDDYSDTTTVYALTPTSTARLQNPNRMLRSDADGFVRPADRTPTRSLEAETGADTTPQQIGQTSAGEESPLVHPCLTREVSRQLKEFACALTQTPSPPKKPRRPSTPWHEWLKKNDEILKQKTEEALARDAAKRATEEPMDPEKWHHMLYHITPKRSPPSYPADEPVAHIDSTENSSKKRREISDEDESKEVQQSSRKKSKNDTSSAEQENSAKEDDDFLSRLRPSIVQPPKQPRGIRCDSFHVPDDEKAGDEPEAGAYWDENKDISDVPPEQPDETEETDEESQADDQEEASVAKDESIRGTIPRMVAMSAFKDKELQARLKQYLQDFGVTVSDLDSLCPEVEAVIVQRCSRSEKTLCAVASGVPLIHPRYVEDCAAEGRLLPMEDYVWQESEGQNQHDQEFIKSALQWAAEIKADPEAKPFFRVCAWFSENSKTNREGLMRLIKVGGGTVATRVEEANLIFGDKEDARQLASEQKVPWKMPKYIQDVILRKVERPLGRMNLD